MKKRESLNTENSSLFNTEQLDVRLWAVPSSFSQVYPTSLSFTKAFSLNSKSVLAVNMMAIGMGEAVGISSPFRIIFDTIKLLNFNYRIKNLYNVHEYI